MHTWLTDQFGLSVPVVCAPMAGVSGGALAAAVSAAGGLGMIGVRPGSTLRWLAEQIDLAAASGRAYGIGLIGWGVDEQGDPLLAQVIAARPALVSISFGDVTEHVAPLHDAGIVVAMQAGNLDEALAADAVGVDLIVARGGEGGGHGRNQIATLPLLQEVLDAVDTPVLGAGGIGTRRGLAAVLAAGADGGWIGTAFMTCPEADTPAEARHAVLEAGTGDTVYSRVFDLALGLGWPPEYGGRSLSNEVTRRWLGAGIRAGTRRPWGGRPRRPNQVRASRRGCRIRSGVRRPIRRSGRDVALGSRGGCRVRPGRRTARPVPLKLSRG